MDVTSLLLGTEPERIGMASLLLLESEAVLPEVEEKEEEGPTKAGTERPPLGEPVTLN